MSDDASAARDLVLRVAYRGEHAPGEPDYLTDLDERGFFLRTARVLTLGQRLALTLSFPGLLDPVDVSGVVRQLSAPDDYSPDAPVGAWIDFAFAGPDERARIAAVLHRFDRGAGPPPSVPFRVLLVEDNHFAHKLFHHAMRRFHYEWKDGGAILIHGAGDGAEGLDVLETSPIDLAIVDFFLPSISGAELIRRIRADARWAHMPVLVISVGGDGVREEALAAGADLYLDKPVLLKQLLNTLHLLVGTP
jgi:CheY-like chemotaxis protein